MPKHTPHPICWLLLAAVTPVAAFAQNLLANGDFATDLSGWDTPAAVWSALDRDAAPNSGSAHVNNASPSANTRALVLHQCVASSPAPGAYVLGASAYAPGQSTHGSLVANALFHAFANCGGGGSSAGFFLPSDTSWQDYAFDSAYIITAEAGVQSIEVQLSVDKTEAGGVFEGYFDAVYLARDTLFFDGFE